MTECRCRVGAPVRPAVRVALLGSSSGRSGKIIVPRLENVRRKERNEEEGVSLTEVGGRASSGARPWPRYPGTNRIYSLGPELS